MTKKNRKIKNSKQEAPEDPSAEAKADLTETGLAESAATASASEAAETAAETEFSTDDLLDDVRRSLIEDEAQAAEEKKSGWWGKITKGRHKEQEVVEDIHGAAPGTDKVSQPSGEDAYLEQIDELIDMLEPAKVESDPELEMMTVASPEITEPEPPEIPEQPVDLDELKKRVFSPMEPNKDENYSEVRAVALEGGEDVFIEVEAKKEDQRQDRVKAFENSIRPYRTYLYFLIALLGVILAALASAVMYRTYQNTRPPTPTPIESNLPYPTALILPGGLSFNLGKGEIVDGEWNPKGPEWLRGTEICRWVAIPWSKQLEAVVRTLTREDTLDITMSNNDRLAYDVFSIQELTLAEMQDLDQNSPCLLLVLAEQDAEKRWVVTAKP